MNLKGQASLELLFVVIVVLSLIVLVFASMPKDTNEITALGIAKNNLDSFILQTNYLGDYTLNANILNRDINIVISFTSSNYDSFALENCIKNMENEVKTNGNFEKVYISYN